MIEHLQVLADHGTENPLRGTCLDFYNVSNKLAVRHSNQYVYDHGKTTACEESFLFKPQPTVR